MKITIIILLVTSYIVLGQSQQDGDDKDWKDWKDKHGKNYGNPAEEAKRKAIYKAHRLAVEKNNEEYRKGTVSYQLGDNQFSAMDKVEFMKTHANYRPMPRDSTDTPVQAAPMVGATACPSSVDWRTSGAVTPVKDQGNCGSCWSFSAVGAIESCRTIAGKAILILSEQQLVDCSSSYGNQGCNGGWMVDAFKYVKAKGLQASSSYPYTALDGTCKIGTTVARITDYKNVNATESALLEAVCKQPICVAIDASYIQSYSTGVFYDAMCSSDVNHGVLVIGYGTTPKGEKYWLVKNSWGTLWGESGYIRIARDRGNHCGIASFGSYPTGCS